MQQFDTPRPPLTLSAMPHIKAAAEAFRLASSYPSVRVPIPDRGAPRGVLQYSIGPIQREDGITYGLYFEGQEVPDPRPLLTRYRYIFDDRLSRVAPAVAQRMYRDLSVDRDERPIVFARTLPKMDTPLPQHYEPERASVTVLHTNNAPRERATLRELSSVLEGRMNDAVEQIRMRVASGEIPVMKLEDASGYYADIIDYQHGQLHQIGISSRRMLPWHVVFQLRNGLNPMRDQYPTPKPRIIGGRMIFDTAHAPYMRHIHSREYNTGNDVVEKQRIKSALGALGSTPGRRVVGVASDRTPPSLPYPSNVIPIRPDQEQPDWLQNFLQQSGPRDVAPQRQLPPIAPDAFPPSRRQPPQPGEFGFRANGLVDASAFPDWLKEAGGPVQFVQQPIDDRSVSDGYGLPLLMREIHPLRDETASRESVDNSSASRVKPGSLRARDLVNFSSSEALGGAPAGPLQVVQQPVELGLSEQSPFSGLLVEPTGEPMVSGRRESVVVFPSVTTLPPLPSVEPYNPYQLVSFGGQTNIHTTYSFI